MSRSLLLASLLALAPGCDHASRPVYSPAPASSRLDAGTALEDGGPLGDGALALDAAPGLGSDGHPQPAKPNTKPNTKPTWTLTGKVTQEEPCPGSNPGSVFVALATTCDWDTAFEVHEHQAVPPATYWFEVPDGTYRLLAFIDCNRTASSTAPHPDAGDVRFAVQGQPCRTYQLSGSGYLELPLPLSELVP